MAVLWFVAGALAAMLGRYARDRWRHHGQARQGPETTGPQDRRFRSLLDTAPVAITLLRFDGTLIYANEAFAELVAAPGPAGVVGTHALDYLAEEDHAAARARLPELEKGHAGKVRRTLVRADGQRRQVLIDSRVVFYEGERVIQSVIADVTEQEKALHDAEHSLSLLRSTIEATADGLLVVDQNRRIVAYNTRFCELWQLDPAELEHRDSRALVENVRDQVNDPGVFARETEAIYARPERESFDVLHFRDGRIVERYSRPQRLGQDVVGRVWSFRDVTLREMAERALRESEIKFAKAFLVSPDAVIISRLRDGYLFDVNAGFERLTGYSRAEAVGRKSLELGLWREEDRLRFVDAVRRHGRVRDMEVDLRVRDGRRRTCLVSAERIELGEDSGLITVVRDVTEQKEAERTLRLSEEKFARAFRSSPDSITISRLRDGLFLDVNEGFEQINGYRREEAIGKTASELGIWEADDRERMVEILQRDGHLRNMPFRFKIHSGEERDFLVSAEVFELEGEPCLVAISRDVTEQKRAEEALKTHEARLRTLVTNVPVVLFTLDREGRFTLSEGKGLATLGLAPGEVVGRSAFELYGDYPDIVAHLRRSLDGEAHVWMAHLDDLVFETTTTPLYDERGEIVGLIGVATDVTERVRATRERERLITELEARNAELERFTYTVSHDLRTPLVTIKNFIGLLQEDLAAGDAGRVRQDVDFIDGAAERMARLLDELLQLSRAGRMVKPEEGVALSAIAAEAAEAVLGNRQQEDVELIIAPDMPVLSCDPVRLGEVFQNLIDNAVRFMGDQPHPRIEIGGRLEDGMARCWVRDNGIGIAPAYHEKVFELFERLETGIDGTGVGLALVRRIAEAHGGRAWVESEGDGRGSTFFFTLRADLKA
ncbi:PAS domain S-box protein [Rhodocaloribacter litoris]|uniref:PAS domain S-box protein n=1 Tax=Rhodocaloribacter litoris TaxID=2558931 RepID=UPI0014229736|nr:PAS domain S-box protein [Rhodocaloribacter litoris]QXD16483.1 PAS domain S-box protein [Rhodocaloribacter litoris]